MEILHWDDALRIGVVLIDNEHRLICAMINDLHKVAEAGQGIQKQVLERSLTDLLDAIRCHFVSEEQLLSEVGYPDYPAHQQLHRDLETALQQFQAKGEMVVNAELIDFLRHWFIEHLQSEDLKYATFLKNR